MALSKKVKKDLSDFFNYYRNKVKFLNRLARGRKTEEEIILLICCYIDRLGNCLFSTAGSSKRSFDLILLTHSGEKETLNLISISDFAFHLLFMAEAAVFLVPKPGRIQYLHEEFKPLIKLADQANIPLTRISFRKFFLALYSRIKLKYRIHPYQTNRKLSYGSEDELIDFILTGNELKRAGATITDTSLKCVLKEYSYLSILYRDFRCAAVHEAAGIFIETRRFWTSQIPYFTKSTHAFFHESVYTLEFPAAFLLRCLKTCISGVEQAIIGRGLLPLSIWNTICDVEDDEFLDTTEIKEKPIGLRID